MSECLVNKVLLLLVKNWNQFKSGLNTKDFKTTLVNIQEINSELSQKRKKEEGLSEAVDSIEVFTKNFYNILIIELLFLIKYKKKLKKN